MTWHANHQTEEGSMCHPFDVEAWRYFDGTHLNFAAEPCNVRLGLCTDGFAPRGSTVPCILVGPLYLHHTISHRMCMSSQYMFLTIVFLGPSNPKYLIDVYLEPLIEELQNLWYVGVLTHDSEKDKTFMTSAPH
ncbi:hypothetical protein Sango_2318400 [Sesamum angolense]|uniref:Uncharacterized protein n=1 Tax=Sesamum angolense TaxID=2727404 RepID=A0AAE1WAI0_9LAMI|nr:hypothetical protein Sango_2318400 [Sesamum angolense]